MEMSVCVYMYVYMVYVFIFHNCCELMNAPTNIYCESRRMFSLYAIFGNIEIYTHIYFKYEASIFQDKKATII